MRKKYGFKGQRAIWDILLKTPMQKNFDMRKAVGGA